MERLIREQNTSHLSLASQWDENHSSTSLDIHLFLRLLLGASFERSTAMLLYLSVMGSVYTAILHEADVKSEEDVTFLNCVAHLPIVCHRGKSGNCCSSSSFR